GPRRGARHRALVAPRKPANVAVVRHAARCAAREPRARRTGRARRRVRAACRPRRLAVPHMTTAVDGKVVIVTGASRGIGRGVARHLAASGARLAVTGRKPDRLEAVATELAQLGAETLARAVDVADRAGMLALVADTVERFGRVDGLVANAQTFRPVMT